MIWIFLFWWGWWSILVEVSLFYFGEKGWVLSGEVEGLDWGCVIRQKWVVCCWLDRVLVCWYWSNRFLYLNEERGGIWVVVIWSVCVRVVDCSLMSYLYGDCDGIVVFLVWFVVGFWISRFISFPYISSIIFRKVLHIILDIWWERGLGNFH